jgi:hypothetical protein
MTGFDRWYHKIEGDLKEAASRNGGNVTKEELRMIIVEFFGTDARTYTGKVQALILMGKIAPVGNPKTSKVFKYNNGVKE